MPATAMLLAPKSGSLVLSDAELREIICERVTDITQVHFPFIEKVANESAQLGEYFVSENLRQFLRKKGYKVIIEPGKLQVERENVRYEPIETRLFVTACWYLLGGGVNVALETRPVQVGGSPADASLLCTHFKEFGLKLHPFVETLVQADGLKGYSWDELGLEPSTKLSDFFATFSRSHKDQPLSRDVINMLAKSELLNPFRPSPHVLNAHVPASNQHELYERWLEQYMNLCDLAFPPP